MLRRTFSLILATALISSSSLFSAEAPSAPATQLCKSGELITWQPCNDQSTLVAKGMPWQAGIGTWAVEGGAVRATEEGPSEARPKGHEAVCEYVGEFSDIILSAEFKGNAAPHVGFVFRDDQKPNNHQGRLIINPDKVELHKMSGIGKTTRREVVTALDLKLSQDEWHTITIEVCGDQFRAVIDGKHIIEGKHERFGAAKGRIGMVAKGNTAQFRNFGIWKAAPKAH